MTTSFDTQNSGFGIRPIRSKGSANFARVLHHPPPRAARIAEFVLANGPAGAGSSNQSGAGDARRALIEADLVDCMVALPGDGNYTSPIMLKKNISKRRVEHFDWLVNVWLKDGLQVCLLPGFSLSEGIYKKNEFFVTCEGENGEIGSQKIERRIHKQS